MQTVFQTQAPSKTVNHSCPITLQSYKHYLSPKYRYQLLKTVVQMVNYSSLTVCNFALSLAYLKILRSATLIFFAHIEYFQNENPSNAPYQNLHVLIYIQRMFLYSSIPDNQVL